MFQIGIILWNASKSRWVIKTSSKKGRVGKEINKIKLGFRKIKSLFHP